MAENSSLVLSIIIVSYNTAELTLKAVQSAIKEIQSSQLKNKTEIFVVDNNSQDETVESLSKLQKSHSFLKLIKNKENLGFAKANNIGIKKSQGKYILLLNSDTEILPGSLSQLINTFEQHPLTAHTAQLSSHRGKLDHLGILAAALLNPDQSYQPQGGALPSLISLKTTLFLLDDIPIIGQLLPAVQETGRSKKGILKNDNKPIQKGWVGGTAMGIRREVINEIGLLDENIFMYGEDMEYCLRAKNKHWDIAIDPQAKIIHYGSASSSSENAILGEIEAFLYIWTKHKPHWQMYFAKMILYFAIKFRIFVFGTIMRDNSRKQIYQKAKTIIK